MLHVPLSTSRWHPVSVHTGRVRNTPALSTWGISLGAHIGQVGTPGESTSLGATFSKHGWKVGSKRAFLTLGAYWSLTSPTGLSPHPHSVAHHTTSSIHTPCRLPSSCPPRSSPTPARRNLLPDKPLVLKPGVGVGFRRDGSKTAPPRKRRCSRIPSRGQCLWLLDWKALHSDSMSGQR